MNDTALILNVDDDDAGRYVKSRILRLAGYDVIEAANGSAAERLLTERSPNLVLLDVKLPDMSGRDLCVRIKADPATARVVVIQTSASHIDTKNRVASLDAGADGYLTTPIEPEELVAHVRALLRMRKAENEREKALDALREADRRKDEFLAMLAHELRNPLAPIRNAVEILRLSEDRATRERARELVGRQVGHLSRLVDDLLEVSRITQRKVVLKRGAVSLSDVVESACEVARAAYAAEGHKLEVRLPPEEIWLHVDAVRLSQVVGNLLHNAGKFTPRGGRVGLEACVDKAGLAIVVTDNGVGIAPEMLPDVFELFSQADRSLARSQGGLGIGLSLAKGLVEMHGGTVVAESKGIGEGSTFTVRLPASAIVPAPDPASRALVPESISSGASRRILVVEDNPDSAESLMLLLRSFGHDVSVVNDGREAVGAARRLRPDVILLDIGLPGMDGFHVARALRELPETSAVRLIAVSGYGQERDRERTKAAGFDLHLVKPVDPVKLTAAIDAVG
ncbi:MAG TPA: response regulator [Usitatibacter sp.]|jgi:signal transduction histidine kinase|nr:response regulator [Usitatibacter sp.]